MNAIQVTSAITALANAMAAGLTTGELTLLAAILVQLGDTLATIATAKGQQDEEIGGHNV